MITKQFRMTVGLLALAAIACVPVLAGQVLRKAEPAKINAPTYLVCKIKQRLLQQGPPESQLTITASSRSGLPKDTTIYWKVGDAYKGSFNLPYTLRPTMSFSTDIHLDSALAYSVVPIAWYYK
jgi:hypothetical protein